MADYGRGSRGERDWRQRIEDEEGRWGARDDDWRAWGRPRPGTYRTGGFDEDRYERDAGQQRERYGGERSGGDWTGGDRRAREQPRYADRDRDWWRRGREEIGRNDPGGYGGEGPERQDWGWQDWGGRDRGLSGGAGGYGGSRGRGGYEAWDRGGYGGERSAYGGRYGGGDDTRWRERGGDPRARGRGDDRSWWDRAGDEISSWFGDEDAERRRRRDADRDRGHSGRGPRGYQRSDGRIREDVSDRLTYDPFVDASDIDVRVEGSEVTLDGHVDDRWAKRHAEDIAIDVPGVTHVQNNLRVRERRGGWGRQEESAGRSSGMLSGGGATGSYGGGTTGGMVGGSETGSAALGAGTLTGGSAGTRRDQSSTTSEGPTGTAVGGTTIGTGRTGRQGSDT